MDPRVLKFARNANRIGALFNRFISNMDRMVLLEFQFSLALVLVGEDENSKKVLGSGNASRANKSRPVVYFVLRVATLRPGIYLQVSGIFSV